MLNKALAAILSLPLSVMLSDAFAQQLADIDGNVDKYGMIVPGISCKTRTNNEATVRNLATGVFNRDSDDPVAVNCGWPALYPWVSDVFANNARVDGTIYVVFEREGGTAVSEANEAFCNIGVTNEFTTGQNPMQAADGVIIGMAEPGFAGIASADEASSDTVSTSLVVYPSGFHFFSAFCRIPKGVRIQAFDYDPIDPVGEFPQ